MYRSPSCVTKMPLSAPIRAEFLRTPALLIGKRSTAVHAGLCGSEIRAISGVACFF